MLIAIYRSAKRVHRMSREGTAKIAGGKGIKWSCSCGCKPTTKPCYPLQMIWGTGWMNTTAISNMKVLKQGKAFVRRFKTVQP